MTFVPDQRGASSAAEIFRIVLVCIIALGLASTLWRLSGSLDMPREYELVADSIVGVVLLLSLNLARSMWRTAENRPAFAEPPNEPLG